MSSAAQIVAPAERYLAGDHDHRRLNSMAAKRCQFLVTVKESSRIRGRCCSAIVNWRKSARARRLRRFHASMPTGG